MPDKPAITNGYLCRSCRHDWRAGGPSEVTQCPKCRKDLLYVRREDVLLAASGGSVGALGQAVVAIIFVVSKVASTVFDSWFALILAVGLVVLGGIALLGLPGIDRLAGIAEVGKSSVDTINAVGGTGNWAVFVWAVIATTVAAVQGAGIWYWLRLRGAGQ